MLSHIQGISYNTSYSPDNIHWKLPSHKALFNDAEVNNSFSIYKTSGVAITKKFLSSEEKKRGKTRTRNTEKWRIADTKLSLSSQSEHTKNIIHWFGICWFKFANVSCLGCWVLCRGLDLLVLLSGYFSSKYWLTVLVPIQSTLPWRVVIWHRLNRNAIE